MKWLLIFFYSLMILMMMMIKMNFIPLKLNYKSPIKIKKKKNNNMYKWIW